MCVYGYPELYIGGLFVECGQYLPFNKQARTVTDLVKSENTGVLHGILRVCKVTQFRVGKN